MLISHKHLNHVRFPLVPVTLPLRSHFLFYFILPTLAVLGLRSMHLLKTFQHAPQVGDAILEGNFLIFARMGILQQLPHVNLGLLLLGPLLPVS